MFGRLFPADWNRSVSGLTLMCVLLELASKRNICLVVFVHFSASYPKLKDLVALSGMGDGVLVISTDKDILMLGRLYLAVWKQSVGQWPLSNVCVVRLARSETE